MSKTTMKWILGGVLTVGAAGYTVFLAYFLPLRYGGIVPDPVLGNIIFGWLCYVGGGVFKMMEYDARGENQSGQTTSS